MGEETRLRAVAELAQRMAAAQELPQMAHAAATGACAALRGVFAAVSVWEPERARLRVLVNTGALAAGEREFPADESYPARGFPEVAEPLHARWSGGGEPGAWVATAAGPPPPAAGALAPGAYGGPGAGDARRAAALRERGLGCCVVAPIAPGGRAWGELYVARGREAPAYGRPDAVLASALASVVGAGVARHQQLAEARRLAFRDPLTGLANRRAVDARLAEALAEHAASGAVVTLVVCDVNGLKRINDTYGHATGDQLLERFGSVLARCGAELPGALVARLGGDEFCLLAVGAAAADVVRTAEGVCRRAGELALGDGVACGVASTDAPVGRVRTPRRLFRLADAAQYRAKAAAAAGPVVAGRGADGRAAVRLAGTPPAGPAGERRRLRGRTGRLPGEAGGDGGAPPVLDGPS